MESLRVTATGAAGELVLAPEAGRFFSIYGIPPGTYDVEVVDASTGGRAHGTAEVRVGEVTEVGVSPD